MNVVVEETDIKNKLHPRGSMGNGGLITTRLGGVGASTTYVLFARENSHCADVCPVSLGTIFPVMNAQWTVGIDVCSANNTDHTFSIAPVLF